MEFVISKAGVLSDYTGNFNGKVVIPEGVTRIKNDVFKGSDIEEVVLPSTLRNMPAYLFAHCRYLHSVTLPEGLSHIPSFAFGWCKNLKNIVIPKSVTHIGAGAFYGCKKLSDIKFWGNLGVIDSKAFMDSGVKSVVFNKKLQSIQANAFKDCDRLVSVDMSDVEYVSLHTRVFENCEALKEVKLAQAIDTLPMALFAGCKSLKKVTMPDVLMSIDGAVFRGCKSLDHIDLPSSLKYIEHSAFDVDHAYDKVFDQGMDWSEVCVAKHFSIYGMTIDCDKMRGVKSANVMQIMIFLNGGQAVDSFVKPGVRVRTIYAIYKQTHWDKAKDYLDKNSTLLLRHIHVEDIDIKRAVLNDFTVHPAGAFDSMYIIMDDYRSGINRPRMLELINIMLRDLLMFLISTGDVRTLKFIFSQPGVRVSRALIDKCIEKSFGHNLEAQVLCEQYKNEHFDQRVLKL